MTKARFTSSCRCGCRDDRPAGRPGPIETGVQPLNAYRSPAHAAAVAAPAMAVRRLDLQDFRNYGRLRLEVGAAPVVLTGPNGAGKTNLLEALSLLVPGRGLRRARLADLSRRSDADTASGWAVAARIDGPAGPLDIGTGLIRDNDAAAERRQVRIGGETAAGASALADVLDAVWLTPAMDGLFLDAPSARRRFLDRLVFGGDPAHARRVAGYERILRDRSRLLADRTADPAWLAALEGTMAELGVAVAAARLEAVDRLTAAMAHARGPFPQAELAVDGLAEGWLREMPATAVEDRFRDRLAANRVHDAEAGGAGEGPHRSDLAVRHAGRGEAAARCSTGEQKALLIAITLASSRLSALRRGAAPLLLLDEIVAHLDAARRRALFDEIDGLGAQAWLAGTEPSLFAELKGRAQFLAVCDGAVAPGTGAFDRG